MQVMFLWDSQEQPERDLAGQFLAGEEADEDTRAKAMAAATSIWEQREMIDQRLERLAPQWPPRRQPGVDRSILRLAVWELTNTDTPPKVVIDEAIELAKGFSTEQSPAFVNGVLDGVLKENTALTAGIKSEILNPKSETNSKSEEANSKQE